MNIFGRLWRKIWVLLLPIILVATADAAVFKVATVSPDGSSWMNRMRAGAQEVEQRTDGRVRFKFYPGGVMGSDKTVLRKIRLGQLQGGALPGGSLASYATSSLLYTLPLQFHSYQEVDFVRRQLDPIIIRDLEKGGFVTFGLAEGGLTYLMSNSGITSVGQLRQKKVWMPDADISSQKAADSFQLNPIPLNIGDVLPGLQTGLVDTIATSPIAAIALQWHTRVSHMTNLPLTYFYAVLALDKKAFTKLSVSDQQHVRQVMEQVFRDIDRQNRRDNIAAFKALQAQGIKLSRPTAAEKSEWQRLGDKATRDMVASGVVSASLYQKLQVQLDRYRSQQGTANQE